MPCNFERQMEKTPEQVIRENIKTKKLVLGTDRTKKELIRGTLSRIFLSSNVPETVQADFRRYAEMSDVPVDELEISNQELGILCKKPFSVSVIGLLE